MNVAQLIIKLQQFPLTHRVIVQGYEGGYNDVEIIQPKRIALNANDDSYYGDHEECDSSQHDPGQLAHSLLLKR